MTIQIILIYKNTKKILIHNNFFIRHSFKTQMASLSPKSIFEKNEWANKNVHNVWMHAWLFNNPVCMHMYNFCWSSFLFIFLIPAPAVDDEDAEGKFAWTSRHVVFWAYLHLQLKSGLHFPVPFLHLKQHHDY